MEYESEETVMVRKTMKINLLDGGKSLQQASRQIEQYKNDLSRKCEEICRRLSEIGVQVANTVLREGKLEDYQPSTKVSYEIDTSGNIVRAKIIISGPYILFLEFGSGIRYSGTKNPKVAELGYGPGTYPSNAPQQNPPYDNWESPTGWYYYGDDGKVHHTFGVQAKMPVYRASVEIMKSVNEVAKEIFG